MRAHVFNVPCGKVLFAACFLFPLSIWQVSAKRWPALVHNVPRGKVIMRLLWILYILHMHFLCCRMVLSSGRQLVRRLSPPQHLAARLFGLQPVRSRLQWHQRPPWSVGSAHQLHRLRPGLLQLIPFAQHNLVCALPCGHGVPHARRHNPRRLHPLPSRGVLRAGRGRVHPLRGGARQRQRWRHCGGRVPVLPQRPLQRRGRRVVRRNVPCGNFCGGEQQLCRLPRWHVLAGGRHGVRALPRGLIQRP